jgi:hypothetical protein
MISRLKTHYLKKMAWTLLRHVPVANVVSTLASS